jgi:sugar fermentation stimulation protein A
MQFAQPLLTGTLIKRYKRFLADVELEDGSVVTAHCPNSGSMKTCAEPGWAVRLSRANNPKRKLKYTWELVHNGVCWIGINTHLANKLTVEAIEKGWIPELGGYHTLRTEVKYGQNSRVDILLESESERCYVEVKNVTLVEADGVYRFPDAVTKRGLKHLHELREMKRQGHRAVMLFAIQRSDGSHFEPAAGIDPEYARALKQAHAAGVEILPYRAETDPKHIELKHKTEFNLDVK